ncbi:MAG: DMT family transporter, partial [Amphritea sp.]|nr:DMT family transporter [Amphritea sp.]
SLTGDLLALCCALSLSAKFVNDRAVKHRDMTPALITGGLFIALASLFNASPLALSGSDWAWMLLLCVIIIPIAFVLITLGPTRITAAEVGMLMLLETVFGPLLVWLFLSEAPTSAALQGGGLVIGTLLLHGYIKWRHVSYK